MLQNTFATAVQTDDVTEDLHIASMLCAFGPAGSTELLPEQLVLIKGMIHFEFLVILSGNGLSAL